MIKLFFLLFMAISLYAKDIQVLFAPSTPPYVFKDGSGIVLSIVKEALAHKNHTVKPVFLEIGRGVEMFKNGYVDATSIIQKSTGLKAFYSDYFMQYHNAAFVLKTSKNIKINSISDLENYHLSAFQNAHIYLGKEFGDTVKGMGDKYSEIADQKQQVYMFLKGRTEIAVMDRHIFKFYKNMLIDENKVEKGLESELIELFPPTKYRTAFKDEKLRDDFNEGLEHLKQTGRYSKIYESYGKKYFKVKK